MASTDFENQVASDWNRTVSNSVIGLSGIPNDGPTRAMIFVETNSIRITEDGSTPTTSNGFLVSAGQIARCYVPGRIKMLRATGTDAVIQTGFYR